MVSDLTKFLEEREVPYKRLEHLLARAERGGLRNFSRDELLEFGHLYRLASADLARARFVIKSPLLSEYLNEIVGRAHHMIHRKRTPVLRSFIRFITIDFPVTFRKEFRPIALAMALLLSSSIIGGISYQMDPEWGQLLMAQPQLRQYEQAVESSHEELLATSIKEDEMAAMSAFIMTNNIQVCFYTIAGGILFGLGTLFILAQNGFLLGVIGSMFLSRGFDLNMYFWSGILPHGVIEIPAIAIAGGIGFMLARGLLMPGKLSRGDALRREGKNAMKLLGGVILILVVAGTIEGFITPLRLSFLPLILVQILKILFSFVLFGGLVVYLAFVGRGMESSVEGEQELRTTTHLRLD